MGSNECPHAASRALISRLLVCYLRTVTGGTGHSGKTAVSIDECSPLSSTVEDIETAFVVKDSAGRKTPAGGRWPSCSYATRRGGLRLTWRICRSWCAPKSEEEKGRLVRALNTRSAKPNLRSAKSLSGPLQLARGLLSLRRAPRPTLFRALNIAPAQLHRAH